MAEQCGQDNFLVRTGGEITVRNQDGSVYRRLSSDGAITNAWAELATLRASSEQHGYSELRKTLERGHIQEIMQTYEPEPTAAAKTSSYEVTGEKVAYAPDFFQAMPHNISGNMLFHAIGARSYPPK